MINLETIGLLIYLKKKVIFVVLIYFQFPNLFLHFFTILYSFLLVKNWLFYILSDAPWIIFKILFNQHIKLF